MADLIGSVKMWSTSTPPSGHLECDGSAVSRTTYSDLFGIIGTDYGIGDGSTTFNLPDYRGYFLRGTDVAAGIDPDAATRTDRGDGTTGDNVGTKQADKNGYHTHYSQLGNFTNGVNLATSSGGSVSLNTSAAGGSENRPINIYIMYVIQH